MSISYKKSITNVITADVAVFGGGPSGFAAAVAAARTGAKVVLIEATGKLGGMSTSGLVGPFMSCYDSEGTEQIVLGIFDEVCRRAVSKGGAIHPSQTKAGSTHTSYYEYGHHNVTPYLSETLTLVYDEIALEAGVEIRFFTRFIDAVCENGRVQYCVIADKAGLSAVQAKQHIDCTGDGDVAVSAGAQYVLGDGEGHMQPVTLFFEVAGIDREKYLADLAEKKKQYPGAACGRSCFFWLIDEHKSTGEWDIPKTDISIYETSQPGRFKVNCTRMLGVDGTDPQAVSKAIVEGRRQVQKIFSFMKKYIPGCEDMMLVATGDLLGVRETRHIACDYTLSGAEVGTRPRYEDAIATYAYYMDLHSPTGDGYTEELTQIDGYYTIPYRSITPKGLDNLLVAGRCIDGDHYSSSAFRCMPGAMAIGQGAGVAAAVLAEDGKSTHKADVTRIQRILREQGAVIK